MRKTEWADIEAVHDRAARGAKAVIDASEEELSPIIAVHRMGKPGEIVDAFLMPPDLARSLFGSVAGKDRMVALVKQALASAVECGVVTVVAVVCEAWTVRNPLVIDRSIPPSEHPDRVEALLITLYSMLGTHLSSTPIKTVDGKRTVDLPVLLKGHRAEGPMVLR